MNKEWLKENTMSIIGLLVAWTSSIIIGYNAVIGRIIVLEQHSLAMDNEHNFIYESLKEMKSDIKDIDKKTDELVKYLIP